MLLKVGIAGLGRTGWYNHGLVVEPMKRKYRVAAVFDKDSSRMEEARARFGCTTASSYSDLVNSPDVDLVVVGLPNIMHADASIEALRAGKHVVCEKPMATSLADADRMVRAARQAKGCLAIFQNRRFASDYLKVKEIIDSGCLGRVTLIKMCAHGFARRWDWQTLRKNGGGSLNNTGPHFVDRALQFIGDRYPTEFFVHLDRTLTLGDADDHAKLVMRAPDAPVVEVEVMSDVAYPRPLWLVTGTKGGLTGTASELRWKWILEDRLPERKLDEAPTPDRSYNSEKLVWSAEHVWRPRKNERRAEARFYLALHETIARNAPPPISAASIRRQIKLLDECHRRCGL